MALSATNLLEIQSGASDTNGGGFDPSNANMATDLAGTNANTSAPVVSSASYNFQARDVNAWIFIKSGSNWLPGWYKIASVASNQATLTATAGTGVLLSTLAPTTATGCATTASPTNGTWSIDYSQTTAAGITYTDMVIQATTTQYQSAANPVGVNVVGNIINVTSGTNFTVQRVQVISVSGTTATCDKSLGTAAASGGNGKLGGAFATPGSATAIMLAGNGMYIKQATYSITSASTNVASGCLSLPSGTSTTVVSVTGYNSVRGDNGTKPLLQASGINTFTLLTAGNANIINNLAFDGISATSSRAINANTNTGIIINRCKVSNCTNSAIVGANGTTILFCEGTGCSTQPVFLGNQSFGCVAHNNTVTGFSQNFVGAICVYCISVNNTGASSDGFDSTTGNSQTYYGCIAYSNGRHGFFDNIVSSNRPSNYINCISENHAAGFGFTAISATNLDLVLNCGTFNNNSGGINSTNIPVTQQIGCVAYTSTAFVNAGGNDFSLNNTTTGGGLLRNQGIPGVSGNYTFPGLSMSNTYKDIGATAKQGWPFIYYPLNLIS